MGDNVFNDKISFRIHAEFELKEIIGDYLGKIYTQILITIPNNYNYRCIDNNIFMRIRMLYRLLRKENYHCLSIQIQLNLFVLI